MKKQIAVLISLFLLSNFGNTYGTTMSDYISARFQYLEVGASKFVIDWADVSTFLYDHYGWQKDPVTGESKMCYIVFKNGYTIKLKNETAACTEPFRAYHNFIKAHPEFITK